MRRVLLILSVAILGATLARPVEAQLKYGVQGSVMTGLEDVSGIPTATGLNGTFGIGARAALQPPLLPVGVVGQGVYYFPEGDGSYMTYSLAGQLRLPLPLVSPYAIGGWQWRRTSLGDASLTENGPMVGVGVQLNLAVSFFLESTFEFNDEITGAPDFDNNPIVIKGGVLLGG
jgi:hypothetical protein